MAAHSTNVRKGLIVGLAALMLATAGGALAGPGGGHGGGGGFHGGGGGFHGGGFHGGGAFHGGPGHGGYGGWHGGYYGAHGYYGGWHGGWGGGFGLGWFLPVLPLGYETLWWGGAPYYYADNNYYQYDDDVGEYQAVEPPWDETGSAPPATAGVTAQSSDLYAYPKAGQSAEQQTRDRDECRSWATSQTGFNPTPSSGTSQGPTAKRQEYLRAEGACLEARDYTVE